MNIEAVSSQTTPEDLIRAARDMIPTLRERAAHCEQIRKIPQETWNDFRDAKLLRAAQPRKFGGFEFGIDTIAEIGMEVGRGCGSSAWMAGQWPGHQFMVGYLPLEAQHEYWDANPDTMSSTASAVAKLNIEPEGDGWRIKDSQMRFSSGCDYAEWIHFITMHGLCLIPKSDFEVVDDWYVSGLRGTGSKSIVIKDAYVPPHRFVSLEQLKMCSTPGAEIYPDNPYYRAPFNLVVNQLLLSATIGMARGVLDIFEERVTGRINLHTFESAALSSGAQMRFAESHAEVTAAMMYVRHNCQQMKEWGEANHVPDQAERAEARRNVAYGALLAVRAAERLLTAGDAKGMYEDHPLGRLGRDVHMAGLQANLTWDEPAQSFSRARWGVEQPLSYLT
ncbi:hypothetical protein JT55_01315 [Rhodovulum sp. NI22]|jgi:3-hydroxy-9,10-secoandrosta-1,3,5(10)-triene-9,17-dione monooxygenase|nr:hypothetical protein JT55_01315 [Rhodovulum sp. NI22]